jgi:succinyl-diaminopimelate desuccinylase
MNAQQASPVLSLAEQLIACRSVTPEDGGCQILLAERLRHLGFEIEPMRFGDVDNLWARRGRQAPLFVFAGHTDVVPPGPLDEWGTDPFEPTVRDGVLHGRGAADMKGSIAAMICAIERFLHDHPEHRGSMALLLTSDEEGPAIDGTVKVVEHLQARGEQIDWCLVGEPTSTYTVGDVVKNGRRGSLSGRLVVHGQQGHVAYPHLAKNPVHALAPVLAELAARSWDAGNDAFPPTTFQVSNIHAGTGATNVIPGRAEVDFNFRYSTESTEQELRGAIEDILERHGLRYELVWTSSGKPFFTPPGELVAATQAAITDVTGRQSKLSTAGGTSDGRFIAPTGAQVLELGPVNASIHKVNENVDVGELETLSRIYQRVLERLLRD